MVHFSVDLCCGLLLLIVTSKKTIYKCSTTQSLNIKKYFCETGKDASAEIQTFPLKRQNTKPTTSKKSSWIFDLKTKKETWEEP